MDREDLNEFVSWNLHELSWHLDYPLVPSAGLWCYLDAMRESGFNVDFKKDPIRISDVFEMPGKRWEMATTISRDNLIDGWKNHPKASPHAFYDSVYLVIDNLHESVNSEFPKWRVPYDVANALSNDRWNKGHKVLKNMEKNFLEYFGKYQEGFLAPRGSKNSDLSEPKILDKLIKTDLVNLERMNRAIAFTKFEEIILSNVKDTIAMLKDGESLEEDYEFNKNKAVIGYLGVSESGVYDYLWGVYLLELAKEKNYFINDYDLEDSKFGVLEFAVDRGWNILKHSSMK